MYEMKFDWDDLRLFISVAQHGGLAAAAAVTGKSAPTLGRRMLVLERHLGTDLFIRHARGYELTEQGEAFLAKALEVEQRLAPLLAPRQDAPVVKVSAGVWVTHLLCQNVGEIAKKGDVHLRFIAADDVLDIARREAVIGVRNKRPQGTGLAGRRIGHVRFAIYARDKSIPTWARVEGRTPSALWARGAIGDAPCIEVTHPRNALDLTVSGATRCVLPMFVGDATPGLLRVSDEIEELTHEQWLVSHHEERFTPEVRRTLDAIANVLKRATRV